MKKIVLFLSFCFCCGSLLAGESTAMGDYVYVGRTFKDWSYDFQDNGSLEQAGRLYVPPGYNPADTTKKYALVVFYHGAGGVGTNNTSQFEGGHSTKLLEAAQQNGFFVYLPQAKVSWGGPGAADGDNSILQIANLLRAYRIDPEKVSLTGFSMGGNAVWSMSGVYAEAIAAAFPVQPNHGWLADVNAAKLVGKPVWILSNRGDTLLGTSQPRGRAHQLRAAGGKPNWTFPLPAPDYFCEEDGLRYSEPPEGGHTTQWAYQKPELYTWLLAQKNTTGWLNEGETIKVDFGSQFVVSGTALDTAVNNYVQTYQRPDSAGVRWNSTAAGFGLNFNAAIPFAKTTAGRSTFVSVHVLDKFAADYNQTGGAATIYDANIGKDGWVTSQAGIARILVRGLQPGGTYRVEIFASGTNGDPSFQQTLYQIGIQQDVLLVYNNVSDKAIFPQVTADANGEFVLEVSGMASVGSVYGMIGTLEITKGTPPPQEPEVALHHSGTTIGSVMLPTGGGNKNIEIIRDGTKPPVGSTAAGLQYDTFTSVTPRIAEQHYGYVYGSNKVFGKVVFQEGRHFVDGGWFRDGTLRVQVRQGGVWVNVVPASVSPAYPNANTQAGFGSSYESYTFTLNNETGDGIRIIGTVGGSNQFTSIGELEVWGWHTTDPAALQSSGTIVGSVTAPTGGGNKNIEIIRDGVKPPVGSATSSLQYDTYTNVTPRIAEQHYGYEFGSNKKVFTKVVFQEGRHFVDGGWFNNGTLRVQVRRTVGGSWVDVTASSVTPAYPNANTQAGFGSSYETYTFTLNSEPGYGVRIIGTVGGSAQFTSIGELEAWGY